MALTRTDARLIAEELMKLFVKSGFQPKEMTPEKYVGTKEACEILGISPRTLYKRIKEIPHTKKGKLLIFKVSALHAYLENT